MTIIKCKSCGKRIGCSTTNLITVATCKKCHDSQMKRVCSGHGFDELLIGSCYDCSVNKFRGVRNDYSKMPTMWR